MEFEISGQTYRATKLDAFKQLHLSRRLAPVLSGNADDTTPMVPAILAALAQMSDSQLNYILHICLSSVQKQQGTAFAPIYIGGSVAHDDTVTMGRFMFDDIDLIVMSQIAAHVVKENLAGFFSAVVALLGLSTPTTA